MSTRTCTTWTGPAASRWISKRAGRSWTGQALGYVRFRADALGDINRVKRQQTLLKAVARQALNVRNLSKAREILGILMEHVRTDMSQRDMASIAWFFVRTRAEIVSETLPGEFSPLYWVPDRERVDELVRALQEGFPG